MLKNSFNLNKHLIYYIWYSFFLRVFEIGVIAMKKDVTNDKQYLAGFSLVELIIVIAISAILVGAVALAVLPYLEKSKESIDCQQIDHVYTAMVTAVGDRRFMDSAFSPTSHMYFSASKQTYCLKDILEEARKEGAVERDADGYALRPEDEYDSDSWTVAIAEKLGPDYKGYIPKSNHAGALTATTEEDLLEKMMIHISPQGDMAVWYGPDLNSIYLQTGGENTFGLGKFCQSLSQVDALA